MRCTIDIETTGLLGGWEDGVADRIHCVVFGWSNGTTSVAVSKEQFTEALSNATTLVCHNILTYDLPVLKKLGWIDSYTIEPDTINGRPVKIVDTLILSRLFDPERYHHGLQYWGEQLGVAKPEVKDWENLSLGDYIHRCEEDVKINEALYQHLIIKAGDHNWKPAIRLEKAFQDAVHRSEMYGMHFDMERGEELYEELNAKMAVIEEQVNANLPPRPLPDSGIKKPPKIRFKKDGSPSAHSIRYFGSHLDSNGSSWIVNHPDGNTYLLGDDIPPLTTTGTMTINNQVDLKQHLLNIGWRPDYYNVDSEGQKKSARFNDPQTKDLCSNLTKLGEKHPWVLKLTEWLMLRHRRNLLRGNGGSGLLNHRRLAYDHRLPAGMLTIGAGTHRVTHRVVANLPRVSTPYGKEIRTLFNVPRGRKLVGFDASALEDRLKGHYTFKYDGGEYANKINDPDFDAHTESSELWGIDRSQAKTGNYAIQFGAGVGRFAKAVGVSHQEGEHFYKLWWDNNYGLRDFKSAAEHYWEKSGSNHVLGIDKRKIPCDNKHKVVNRIIQSAGAIVMKMATVLFDRMVQREGLDAHMIEFYHDELVVECSPGDAERALEIGIDSIRRAGRKFNLNVDLDADGAVGQSWADVH